MSAADSVRIDQILSEWIRAGFAKAYPDADTAFGNVHVVATAQAGFGDYQCNGAMASAKIIRRPPPEIAQAVIDALEPHEAVEKLEIAGLGFINIHLKTEWLAGHMDAISTDERLGVPGIGGNETVILDYSSPNIAKPMHIGHIRSTIIGNSIDRMHRFLGFNVIADNHVGDWGTQFGILIMGYRNFLDEKALEEDPVVELERLYVKSYEHARADEDWMNQCRQELVKLQAGDEDNLALWKKFVALSLDEFDRVYKRLGVSFDMIRGESHYSDKLQGIIDELDADGISEESEGALVVCLESDKLDTVIVRKSDGAFNYTTTDIATIKSRVKEFNPARIVYITDERQQLHFKQVFTIARKLGVVVDLEHVWFGLMRLPEGTFSTREGNVIKLERMLDEAESRALAIVKASSTEMDEDQQKDVARAVGIGAVKYADLSQNPQTNITFTWDKALALDGNSGPYLQYAYARIASVLDKYTSLFPDLDSGSYSISLGEEVERNLAIKVARFPEAVTRAALSYKPSVLADYLYDLAQTYSSFYQNVPFLKAEEGVRESRVRLCGLVASVLRKGLGLLGIETPNRI